MKTTIRAVITHTKKGIMSNLISKPIRTMINNGQTIQKQKYAGKKENNCNYFNYELKRGRRATTDK